MLPVAIYLRISEDPLGLRAGVARQLADGTRIAESKFPGHPIIVYEDNDTSAYKKVRRPEYERLCADVGAGRLHAVIAYNQDRFLRLPKDLETFLDLCEGVGFTRFLTAEGDIDLSSHDGQLKARIMAAVAKKSSDDTSRRVTRANQDLLERGLWVGRPPFGYDHIPGCANLTLDPSARPILESAYQLFRSSASFREIARRLSPSHPSAPQTPSGWRASFLSPAWAGLNTRGYPGDWTPIITHTQYADLVSELTDPSRQQGQIRGRHHWLTGLLHCHKCRRALGFNNHPKYAGGVYSCPSPCRGTTIPAVITETRISEMLFHATPTRTQVNAAARDAQGEASQAAAEREARLAGMARSYMLGEITRGEWEAARSAFATMSPDPAPRTPAPTLPPVLEDAWPLLSADRRHVIARHYLNSVTVLPRTRWTPRFDTSRLLPDWKS